jgi:dTDP-4-dehydrorhamnose reductase
VRILLTGSNGLLGKDILDLLNNRKNDVYVLNRNIDYNADYDKSIICDISNKSDLARVVSELAPEIIIHAAAIVDIELCEKNPTLCFKNNYESIITIVNSIVPKCKLIFISTDSVFDSSIRASKSSDTKNPINIYSKCKSYAEDYIESHHHNHIIIRTNMYGFHKNWRGSLVEWAIDNLISGSEFEGYENVYFNPLYTRQICAYLESLIDIDYVGVIHLGSNERISKYDFILNLIEMLGISNHNLIKSELLSGRFAPRHNDTTLDVSFAKKIMPNIDNSILNGLRMLTLDLKEFKKEL